MLLTQVLRVTKTLHAPFDAFSVEANESVDVQAVLQMRQFHFQARPLPEGADLLRRSCLPYVLDALCPGVRAPDSPISRQELFEIVKGQDTGLR